MKTIEVLKSAIRVIEMDQDIIISLTDIAKTKDDRSEIVIQHWIRQRNTIDYLELWELLYNKDFKHTEIDVLKNKIRC